MKLSAYLALVSSIVLAAVAAWYSIIGLVAIFAGAMVPIIIMGVSMETGKLVAANWLHRNWKHANLLIKTYLTIAVMILMLITSIGIFGFLSKAHLDQKIKVGGTNDLQLEQIERKLSRQREIIRDAESVIAQLDSAVETLVEYDRIRGDEGALAVRNSQKQERDSLNAQIDEAYAEIEQLETDASPLRQEQLSLEADVGPLKYIAELIYGKENSSDNLDVAVRGIMLLLVLVFDPLAVVLLLAANNSFERMKYSKMFTEQGEHIIDPNNVFVADDPIDLNVDDNRVIG